MSFRTKRRSAAGAPASTPQRGRGPAGASPSDEEEHADGAAGGDYDSGYDSSSPPFLPLEETPVVSNRRHSSNKKQLQQHGSDDDGADGGGADTGDNHVDGILAGASSGDRDHYASSDDGQSSADLRRGHRHLLPSSGSKQQRRRRKRGKGGVAADTLSGRIARQYKKYQLYLSIKMLVSFLMVMILAVVFWDALFRKPEDRWIKPESSLILLEWVQGHPLQGLLAILLVIAFCVVVMVPLGTPLTLGCGYVYKGAYGWKVGVTIATVVSMAGSALGAVVCFLLGRYLMRETVRKWVKKYPLFDAIDIASAEHGLRIMAMLYLTPILPLGPVSYMCGTTSMKLSSFVMAKVAATPLMLLYVFIGASTGSLISKGGGGSKGGADTSAAAQEQMKEIEENEYLIVSGILLSFVMIACITSHVKKELNQILERQQKLKPGEKDELFGDGSGGAAATEEAALEMGITRRRVA